MNQEIFNRAWARANEMTAPAQKVFVGRKNPTCSYRSLNGPCLIGAMIKDEHYKSELEGKSASYVTVLEALVASGIYVDADIKNLEFLERLQYAHDESASDYRNHNDSDLFKSDMLTVLRDIAKEYELTVPEGEVK